MAKLSPCLSVRRLDAASDDARDEYRADCLLLHGTSSGLLHAQLAVERQIAERHARRAESLLEALAHPGAVEAHGGADRGDRLVDRAVMKPVTPGSTISGTEPRGQAMTGVPQDMASIMTRPNGSGQSMGKSSAEALPRNEGLSSSLTSPTNSISGTDTSGATRRQ